MTAKTKVQVKEWFYEKMSETSNRYNCYIDFERNEEGQRIVDNGFVTLFVEEVLGESEKAVQVVLRTGSTLGSVKGWKTWMPKSVIA